MGLKKKCWGEGRGEREMFPLCRGGEGDFERIPCSSYTAPKGKMNLCVNGKRTVKRRGRRGAQNPKNKKLNVA